MRIQRTYPITNKCPTCEGRGKYTFDFKVYDCDCVYQKLLQKHYFAANIPREYHDICLKDFIGDDRDAVTDAVERYLENVESNFHYGLGLSFSGPYGTGKTFAMTSILKEMVKEGRSVYFITFEELINVWGAAWSNEEAQYLLDKLKSVEFLGMDEWRTDPRNSGGFLANGLDNVLRWRTSNLLPTFITTNMLPKQEEAEFDKAFSLLAAANDRVLTIGGDKRQNEVRVTKRELAKLNERRPIC